VSAEVQEFIGTLRARLTSSKVAPESVERIIEEILNEYEMMPGPIRTIAGAVLLEWGYLGAMPGSMDD